MGAINLEHHVTTPALPEALEAMAPWMGEGACSASGVHSGALQARKALEEARESMAALVGMPGEVVFTGSGTEAINLAVQGYARAHRRFGRRLVATEIAHPAVLSSLELLEGEGFEVRLAPVDSRGFWEPGSIEEALGDEALLACTQLGNMDSGTVQRLEGLGRTLREKGVAHLVDATAGMGWTEAPVPDADMVALAPHRFGGPPGVGCLWRKRGTGLEALIRGGLQEGGARAGTENVWGIVGAGAAARAVAREGEERCRRIRDLQRLLFEEIAHRIDGVSLNGPGIGPDRLCNHLSLAIRGVEAEGLALVADMRGLRVGVGSGCLGRTLEPNHVLRAMGLEPREILQTLTMAVGRDTTSSEARQAARILEAGVERMRSLSPAQE